MKVKASTTLLREDAPVFVIRKGARISSHPFFKHLSRQSREYLGSFSKSHSLNSQNHIHVLFLPDGIKALFVGVESSEKFSLRRALLTMRLIIRACKKEKIKRPAILSEDFAPYRSKISSVVLEYLVCHAYMADFEFAQYKSISEKKESSIEQLTFVSSSKNISSFLFNGAIIGEAVNGMRVLSNTPGGDMTPALLAAVSQKESRLSGIRVRVLQEKEMKKLGMRGVLAVAKGSKERPRFIILEYLRGGKKEKPLVFVGKGVTFDTGGLNLKPGDAMSEMHMDMSGGAAVLYAMQAIARLKLKKNVVGLIPAVENMPSGTSYRPGDIIKTMSGKTVEVLDTDAEGRIILADALTYAKEYKPRLVVDVATLTGAAMVALGQRASALFTSDSKLESIFREVGEKTGDYVWPLPLWEEYEDEIKGTFADIANIGKTRYGGAITGAAFLWQFAKDFSPNSGQAYPWVHIDIAPRMTAIEGEHLAKGSAGAAVALLVQLAREY